MTSIRSVIERSQRQKEELLSVLSDIHDYIASLPPVDGMAICSSMWPDVLKELRTHRRELEQDTPALLVAGIGKF